MNTTLYYSVENGVIYVRDPSGAKLCFDTPAEFRGYVKNMVFTDPYLDVLNELTP